MFRPIQSLIAAFVLAGLCHVAPTLAEEPKPCEPNKLATRYPGLVGRTIHIGQDAISMPFSFRDPEGPDKIVGADADHARAVFACIGLPVEFVIGQWSGLLPAAAAGRIDVMWDILYYTPERAKILDYVTYSAAQDAALLRKGNPKHVNSLEDLCGVRAMGGLGTVEIALLQEWAKKCLAAGKSPIDVVTYQDRASAWQMLQNDRTDVILGSATITASVVAQKPDLEAGFTFMPDIKVGVGVTKGQTQLEQALFDAIGATQASGEMARIYTQYKLDPALIRPPSILTQ